MTCGVELPYLKPRGGFDVDDAVYGANRDDGLTYVKSISELIGALKEVTCGVGREVWYRGHRHFSWKLEPTFFRNTEVHPVAEGEADLIRTRQFLLGDLDQTLAIVKSVLAQHGQSEVRSSDALLLAQHYRVGTPLLDWTTSPLVAAWFAIEKSKKIDPMDPPTLWLFDPQFANMNIPYQLTKQLQSQPGIEFELLVRVLERDGRSLAESAIVQDFPCAVYSSNDFTTRIGRQSGKFTFSGPNWAFKNVVPGGATSGPDGERSFAPLFLDPQYAEEMLQELRLLGVHEETVYGPKQIDDDVRDALAKAGLTANGKPLDDA